jgi:hypothetical protein
MRRSLCTLAVLLALWAVPALAQIETNFSQGGGIKIGDSTTTCDAAAEGAILYDSNGAKALQFCNGTSWKSLGADPCATPATASLGAVCADGALFAGRYNGNYYFVSAGYYSAQQWKTTTTTTAGTTSTSNGLANTDAMQTAGLANHPAAQVCRNLGASWYLPAQDELSVYLRLKMLSLGSFATQPNIMSSTETSATQYSYVTMSTGAVTTTQSKTSGVSFLCVRN